jgi:hypothetical protein
MPTPENCPEPYWHQTHRYCPACTWTEEYDMPAEVTELGEDGESWMVTHANDTPGALAAVLEYERAAGNRSVAEMVELEDQLTRATAEHRTDWWYCPANRDADYVLRKGEDVPVPVAFAGTWVSL